MLEKYISVGNKIVVALSTLECTSSISRFTLHSYNRVDKAN